MISRRSFLSRSGLAAAAGGTFAAPHIARSAEQLLNTPGQKPKRIIHIVSDGMSMGTLTCANIFSELTRKRQLAWANLLANPSAHQALMNTRSLNSMVTDSSASASAWGSGSRVVNGAVNILPDGKLLTPIYSLFAEKGWSTGLVTTAEITHATPAGFAIAIKSRGNSDGIAVQYLDRKVDVLLGGGSQFFSPNKRKDKRDLRGDFAKAGYAVVRTAAELRNAPQETRLLGTFGDGHLPYTIDRRADPKLIAAAPTIAELTSAALARLERNDRFILQIEGARIDHAAHNSDAAAAILDQIALDEAVEVCLEFQRTHPDTLIVMTTDHGNSNLGLNGMGGGYRTSSQKFATLGEIKISFPRLLKRLERAGTKIKVPPHPTDPEDKLDVPDPMVKIDPNHKPENEKEDDDPKDEKSDKTDKAEKDDDKTKFTAAVKPASAFRVEPKAVIDIIAEATGYRMSERRAVIFTKVLAGEYPALYDQMNSVVTQLGQIIANRTGLGWTGNTHTADYVTLVAIGPGAERFRGIVQNTDIFGHYTGFAGIDFKNASAPQIAHAGPEAGDVEDHARYALA